jgi:hypothetical protein
MLGRLLLVAAIAAVGAGLLLNGGLAAEGAAPWLPINKETGSKPNHDGKHQRGTHDEHKPPRDQNSNGHSQPNRERKHSREKQREDGGKSGKTDKRHCLEDSAGTQYCDTPPKTPAEDQAEEPSASAAGPADAAGSAETGEVAAAGTIAPAAEE